MVHYDTIGCVEEVVAGIYEDRKPETGSVAAIRPQLLVFALSNRRGCATRPFKWPLRLANLRDRARVVLLGF